jgi:hypothetical protein
MGVEQQLQSGGDMGFELSSRVPRGETSRDETVARGGDPGGFNALLAEIDRVLTERAVGQSPPLDPLRPLVGALTAWCRASLPDPLQVRSFLASSASRDEKIRILGRLGDELARTELMLGGLYNGAPSGTSWRASAGSERLFPLTYLQAAGGLPGDADWCTAFAGYGYVRLGADEGVTRSFGSGGKQCEHGAIVFPQSSWRLLHQLVAFWQEAPIRGAGITSIADLVQRFLEDAPAVLDRLDPPTPGGGRTAFEQYLHDHGGGDLVSGMKGRAVPASAPSVGDLLILGTHGPAAGPVDDHTVMVDRFSFPTLSTIEGNFGEAAGTRQLDLTNVEHLGYIHFISRPAQQIVDARTAGGAGDPGAGAAQLSSVREHNERLLAVFMKLSSGGSTASYAAPAHAWSH